MYSLSGSCGITDFCCFAVFFFRENRFLILLFAVILVLDIKFPNLFWILRHRPEVDGGEPSDWYYFGQKIGRGALRQRNCRE